MAVLAVSVVKVMAAQTEDLRSLRSAQDTIRNLFQVSQQERNIKAPTPALEKITGEVSGKGEVKGEGPIYWFGSQHWFSSSLPVKGTIQLAVADYTGSVTLKGDIYVSGNDGAFQASGEGDVIGDAELTAPGGRTLKFKVTKRVKVSGPASFVSASVNDPDVEISQNAAIEMPALNFSAQGSSNQGVCRLEDMRERLCFYRCSDASLMKLAQVEQAPCAQFIAPHR